MARVCAPSISPCDRKLMGANLIAIAFDQPFIGAITVSANSSHISH